MHISRLVAGLALSSSRVSNNRDGRRQPSRRTAGPADRGRLHTEAHKPRSLCLEPSTSSRWIHDAGLVLCCVPLRSYVLLTHNTLSTVPDMVSNLYSQPSYLFPTFSCARREQNAEEARSQFAAAAFRETSKWPIRGQSRAF